MKLRIFYNKRLDISLIFFLLLLIISCENNPVNVIEKDSEIIFDYLNFDIEITDKTDSTCTINLKSTVIYHSENSGFQIFADGYYFYNSDRTDGFGMMADFYRRRISYPRHITLEPRFISAGERDTLTYENQYTDIEINYYVIFEYQMFGVFTDEPINSEYDSLAAKSFYYYLADTLKY